MKGRLVNVSIHRYRWMNQYISMQWMNGHEIMNGVDKCVERCCQWVLQIDSCVNTRVMGTIHEWSNERWTSYNCDVWQTNKRMNEYGQVWMLEEYIVVWMNQDWIYMFNTMNGWLHEHWILNLVYMNVRMQISMNEYNYLWMNCNQDFH